MRITFDESTSSQIAEAIQKAEWVVEQPSVRFDASRLIAGLESLRDEIEAAINQIDKMNAAFQDGL